MKKALITGITGQDGSYLAEFLLEKGYEVYGLQRRASTFNTSRIDHLYDSPKYPNFLTYYADLSDGSSLNRVLDIIIPDEIYNLGAQSHVRVSFDIPEYTCDVTGLGTLRILDAIREAGIKTKFYQASSSEMFGKVQEIPQKETTPFYPRSPYGCAKVFAYWITRNYRESYNLFACNGILFNHESPRRGETFVTRKITRGLSRIKLGKEKTLFLGNIDAKRDWGYAKDYIEGMWLMLQQETPDDYVLATGETHSVREFVEQAGKTLDFDIIWDGKGIEEKGIDRKTGRTIIAIDQKYFRPAEVDLLVGDYSKAKEKLGWMPKTKFEDLVRLMVEADFEKEKSDGLSSDSSMLKNVVVKPSFANVSIIDNQIKENIMTDENQSTINYSSLVNEKIMVAGGTGFLGKRVVKRLNKEKIPYTAASRSLGVDFRDLKQTEDFFEKEKPTVLINCAANIGGLKYVLDHAGEIYYDNTQMNLNLFECARKYKIKRIINPIANCSYPDVVNKDFKEEEWWQGPLHESVIAYGFVKKGTWVNAFAYNKQYKMDVINFIVPNMYGPEDHFDEYRSHALGAILKRIINAREENIKEVVIWGTGKAIREWLYIDDCVEAFMRALLIDPVLEPINLGHGGGISIGDLAYLIKDISNYKGNLIFDTSKPDGAAYKVMNVDRLKKIFNWSPSTKIEDGIKKTIDWYYYKYIL